VIAAHASVSQVNIRAEGHVLKKVFWR